MKRLRIEAGLLVDGSGAQPIKSGAVLVEGGHILEVGPAAAVATPEGTLTVSFPGSTLMPGLVDCHTHINMPGDGSSVEQSAADGNDMLLLRSAANVRIMLQHGVTTASENGAFGTTAYVVKEAIQRRVVQGPRLFVCGRALTMTGGHAWPFGGEADGVDGLRLAVRRLFKEGADYIKVMATGGSTLNTARARASYSAEELKAITDEAHAWGRIAVAHATGNLGIARCLDAGFDLISHCSFYEPEPHERAWPDPFRRRLDFGRYAYRADIARRIADQGIPVNPTMHTHRIRIHRMQRLATQRPLTENEKRDLENLNASYAERCDYFQKLLEAGVILVAGSDCGWGPPVNAFYAEVEAMVDAGMSANEAVVAATLASARAMGIAHEVGSLERGKRADLLLVDGDPTSDIRALGRVVAVYMDGEAVALPSDVRNFAVCREHSNNTSTS